MIDVTQCLWCGSKKLSSFAHRKDGVGIIKCGNCQLLMVDQFPENLDEYYYSEDYYNGGEANIDTGYAEMYDLMAPAFLFWQNSLVEEVNESHAKKHFLEIGSATGNLLEILRDNQPNLVLKGIDISQYAVGAAQNKGLDAQVAFIEKYQAKPKLDIIFSSETMEHLDNLKSFLEGVANSLDDDGTFLFYVPSISLADAEKERDNYLRFNVNLEHLLHFSPEFFQKELTKFFKANVLIKEFKTDFGPCIVGAVSKNAGNLQDLKKLFGALESNSVPANASDILLKNLVVFALKFGQFGLAQMAFAEVEKRNVIDKKDLLVLKGLLGYHQGELNQSNKYFEDYLKLAPGSLFGLKSLLANERELVRLTSAENESMSAKLSQLTVEARQTKEELKHIKESRFLKPALFARRARRALINRGNVARAKLKHGAKKTAVRVIPRQLRGPIKYAITREWQVKHTQVENRKIQKGRPLVSVVIPYFNRAATIAETLASLRNQTFKNFEVIVVDDGSVSEQRLDKIEKRHFEGLQYMLLAHPANKGVAATRNTGVAKAKGKYVMCLDSDDLVEPTYIEKFVTVLETNPQADVVSSDMRHFGVNNYIYKEGPYEARALLDRNMLTSASMFSKEGWQATGGYKSNLGYEDWEYWINLAEHGFWGKNIAEPLLNYRSAESSRYIDDQTKHKENVKNIHALHPGYASKIRQIQKHKRFNRSHLTPETMFANLSEPELYKQPGNKNPNILIAVPWMTFGGAETLIYNFCREVKDSCNISFVTGLSAEHEWEYKFKEISPNIYHLANMFDDKQMHLEFISNYITSRKIDVLHMVHCSYVFKMLPELKRRHPELKVALTLFNDRTESFGMAVQFQEYIDVFSSDNEAVGRHYKSELKPESPITIIPNGIDCDKDFSPALFDRGRERRALGIGEKDLAVIFVGRLSVEKNPDVFVAAAKGVIKSKNGANVKFFIVGDGPMKAEIDKAIKATGSENIVNLGYQSKPSKYLSAADIYVLPSSIEGFPLAILEAMAMRVAPIASNVGGVPDIIDSGKDGFIVTPGSAKEITEAILTLQKKPDLLSKIKKDVRQKISDKYSSKVLGLSYKKLYSSVLKKK